MSITGSEQWMYSSGREFYDFPIEQSLRFEGKSAPSYLQRTHTAGSNTTWTFSWWFKPDLQTANNGTLPYFLSTTGNTYIRQQSSAGYQIEGNLRGSGGTNYFFSYAPMLRDPSAWYHCVLSIDTTQATSSNRVKFYLNGEQQTTAGSLGLSYPPLNHNTQVNTAVAHRIGAHPSAPSSYAFSGYMADVNFIDGQALDPTSFGETKSGIWIPKDTADLTFGTNGFRLQFGDTTEASGFNGVTYTGNGSSQSISGVGFSSSPDLVWIKQRDGTEQHQLFDTVRGAPLSLSSSGTFTENNNAQRLQSFDSDGFTLGNDIAVNQSAKTYVGWAWDAGSGSAASNTDGSITSTVKANTDYGFSIVSYTGNSTAGATVGHGLGDTVPDMIIVKNRSAVQDWRVYHSSQGSSKGTSLNTTDAFVSVGYWNNTDPTSTVFSVDGSAKVNASGNNYIAYCFAEKTGYSKFGTYTGTGAAGNSITGLGFKPAFLLARRTDSASNWGMWDNTRDTEGTITKYLIADLSNVEGEASSVGVDFDDDGFTFQGGSALGNVSGGSYIFMAFADTRNAAFWRDTSGQGNDWQPNNLVFSDVVPDSTSNNFNTFSSVIPSNSGSLSEGNLKSSSVSGGASNYGPMSSYNVHSGKWYFEFRITGGTANDIYAGAFYARTDNSIRFGKDMAAVYNGKIYADGVAVQTGLANPATNDVFGFAVDVDNSTCQVYRNGSTYGTLVDFSSSSYISNGFMGMGHYHGSSSTNSTAVVNYGQDSTFAGATAAGGNADENGYGDFQYAPASGYLSLCSANLPTGAIDTLADETPEDYFNTVLYTGNGTGQSITTGHASDFVWLKTRALNYQHSLYDSVRGGRYRLASDQALAEADNASANLQSFDTDGFTVGTLINDNTNGQSYVGWSWKAGGTGVSNTDGSITSTVSVGATSQQNWFSIVGYQGTGANATVGHGLGGTVPDMIIAKRRNTTGSWGVYHSGMTSATYQMWLNLTNGETSRPAQWNSTAPTSSVFSIGTDTDVNASGSDYIAYCFANAEGLCKVGSYTGNGSTDGVFVYTGHKPSLLLIKETGNANSWELFDTARDPDNVASQRLFPNTDAAEATTNPSLDILSNGFKARAGNTGINRSGGSYIFLSISEQPFKFANAR